MRGIRIPARPKTRVLLLAAAATAVGIALVPVGGTYALWNDVETVSPGTITSGSLTLAVDRSELDSNVWSNLLPGQSAVQAFTVTNTGTVAAFLTASVTAAPAPAIATYMTLRLTPVEKGAECAIGLAGPTAPLTAFAATVADLPAGDSGVLCAEIKLTDAPPTVQGQTASFDIALTATQK